MRAITLMHLPSLSLLFPKKLKHPCIGNFFFVYPTWPKTLVTPTHSLTIRFIASYTPALLILSIIVHTFDVVGVRINSASNQNRHVTGETYDTQPLASLGIRPVSSVKAVPSLVKKMPKGRKVGYSSTYTTTEDEWVATFMLGYGDGYWRSLSNSGVIVNDATGTDIATSTA